MWSNDSDTWHSEKKSHTKTLLHFQSEGSGPLCIAVLGYQGIILQVEEL